MMHEDFSSLIRPTIHELFAAYIEARQPLHKRYASKLRRVARALGDNGCTFADQLDDAAIHSWLAIEKKAGAAMGTILTWRDAVFAVWRFARDRKLNANLPDDRPKGRKPKLIAAVPGSLRELFRNSYVPRRLRGKSANAIRLHENSLNNFALFLGREALLSDLNNDQVAAFLGWLRSRGRTASTANNNKNRLCALWSFAAKRRLTEEWPELLNEPEPQRIPRAWTAEELSKLFAACWAQTGDFEGVPCNRWWLALHLIAWDTCERIGAVMSVQWSWVDLSAGILHMPAESRKGRRSDREYPLHQQTVELLDSIREPRRELVLPWPYVPNYLYRFYDRIQEQAGLPRGREFRFHALRKAAASHGKVAGLDPQSLLGHADARVTRKYLDPAIIGRPAGASTLFRPFTVEDAPVPPLVQPQR